MGSRRRDERRRGGITTLAALCAAATVSSLWGASSALAAPPILWQRCETGFEAGQCRFPHGIAANSANGHLTIADRTNARVVELTAWGDFVKAWGWDVVATGPGDTGTGFEICIPADGDECKAGTSGAGTGQFSGLRGAAVDSAGDGYLVDSNNHRVQKFSTEGQFELMFGGEVDKTTGAEVCTKADIEAGDECGAGITGTGPGEFGSWQSGNFIAIDTRDTATTADDKVWVGDVNRIQRFDAEGVYQGEIPTPGKTVQSLAVDTDGFLYVAFQGEDAYKLDPETAVVLQSFEIPEPDEFTDPHPRAVAVGSTGTVYLFSDTSLGNGFIALDRIFAYDPAGKPIESFGKEEFGPIAGLATNICAGSAEPGSLYVANAAINDYFVRAYGTAPLGCEEPPLRAPQITDQYAVSAGTDTALLGAKVKPQFIPGTTYHVEYGTEPCAGGGCEARLPLEGEEALGGGITNDPVSATPLLLTGLEPGTAYHYRFVAESPGGGPEYGLRPDGEEEVEGSASPAAGLEGTFTTHAEPLAPKTDCANQALRSGPSSFLAECRAFELVSPVDKNGGGIETLTTGGSTEVHAAHDQSSTAGEAITYSAKTAFAEPLGAPYSSQYLSRRDPEAGWETRSLNAPHEGFPGGSGTTAFDTEYKAFSPDLTQAWTIHQANPPLAPCAPADSSVLYRRETGTEEYEALHCRPNGKYGVAPGTTELLGVSADGCRAVFRSISALTPDAGEGTFYRLYESSCEVPPAPEGPVRLISRLPGGEACEAGATAGSIAFADNNDGRGKLVWNALSKDAHRLYWTCGGSLYLRTDPDLNVEGDETVVQIASPVPVLNLAPQFLTASPDGSRALYTAAGPGFSSTYRLLSYDAESGESVQIAKGMEGGRRTDLLGASEDATRAYFASTEVLSGEPNSEGDSAQEGEPNLYLYDANGEAFAFVATLGQDDLKVGGRPLSPIYPRPYHHAARVSPDGLHAAFISTAPLTGFDNRDLASGEADAEVFLYDAAEGELRCVSCNPTGVRPRGRKLGGDAESDLIWAAAWLPGWQSQLYQGNPLSANGDRLFFNSFEALVNRDTNERQDVYEWTRSESAEVCEELGAETYAPASGGCLSLLSSGQDPEDSEFVDADPGGDNVFIRTAESLLAKDPGLVDIYDARVGGGFPEAESAKAPCEGQACQTPPAPPLAPDTASSAAGPPNPTAHPDCRAPAKRARRLTRRAKRLRRAARRSHSPRRTGRLGARARQLARAAEKNAKRARRCRARNRSARTDR